jgi:hypothetical protein
MNRYCAFDLEIVKPLPDGVDNWKDYRPLGISCAATLNSDGELCLWHGRTPAGGLADQISPPEAAELVAYLQAQVEAGFTPLTWNGLGFDFDILAEESGLLTECRELATWHVDMLFHIFCMKGFAVALDRAARGMGLPGKTAGMTGALAPQYWAQGRRQEVLDYVVQDARTTLELAQAGERTRALRWITTAGKLQSLPLAKGWLTVREAMFLPEPDVSWMRAPWKRSKFTGWLR